MKIAHYVVTQEHLRAVLGLPDDAVILRVEIESGGSLQFLVHASCLPDLPEGFVPRRVSGWPDGVRA